jgi:hypothetical protein
MEKIEQYKEQYSIKKGIGFGAFGGFIAAVGFTGIMLWMPLVFAFPTGTFLHTLATSVIGVKNDPVVSGLAAFSVVLLQGIVVGIVFGIITSKVSMLHPSNKKRGVVLGVGTGIIAFLVLYLPVTLTVYPELLAQTLATFPNSELSIMGRQPNTMLTSPYVTYLPGIMGLGIFAYIAYGFLMGGIVTLAYSVYHFDIKKILEIEAQGKINKDRGRRSK